MIRRTPVKKRRAKPRRGPLRDEAYRKWLAEENWCVVGERTGSETCSTFIRRCDAAHTANNGLSSKGPDSSCAPLCPKHHREYDAGRKAFEKKYGVDMQAIAAELWKHYESERAT